MRTAARCFGATSALLLFWITAGYPLTLMVLGACRRRGRSTGIGALPSITVIVPTYREEATIVARLENLEACKYPPELLDVIVVDSGAADCVPDFVDEFAARSCSLRIRLLRQAERAGKASAINLGLDEASGDIVIITDAPTAFDQHALERVAAAFADPAVGAATGYLQVTGTGDLQREEARFWRVRNALRHLEARVDSTPFLSGELCAFRRNLVDRLDEDTLADDMNVALQVRRRGSRVVICDDVFFSERRTDDMPELIETKGRRAAGGIQELLRFRGMLLNPRYGLFGMLILPSALLYYVPLRIPYAVSSGWLALSMLRTRSSRAVALAVVGAGMCVSLMSPRLKGQAYMMLFNERIFLEGWLRYMTKRLDVRWKQERTTRALAATERVADGHSPDEHR